jgi:hypothetical protein
MDIYIHDTYFEISNTAVAVVAIVLLLIVAGIVAVAKFR